jgi:UDP-N-acetylmuramoyl-tripeptide--D-alanyl-D-alanine ligase
MMSGIRVIDDAYNAAPTSMLAALATLQACRPRRFAALGAMGELGTYATDAHLAIGHTAATSGLELLIVFGSEADGIAEGARAGGMPIEKIMRLSSDAAGITAAIGLLGDMASVGDTILVKASRSVALERLVDGLAARWSEVSR